MKKITIAVIISAIWIAGCTEAGKFTAKVINKIIRSF